MDFFTGKEWTILCCKNTYIVWYLLFSILIYKEKKKYLTQSCYKSPYTSTPPPKKKPPKTPKNQKKKNQPPPQEQRDNTRTQPITSFIQRWRTDLGRSVWVTTSTDRYKWKQINETMFYVVFFFLQFPIAEQYHVARKC